LTLEVEEILMALADPEKLPTLHLKVRTSCCISGSTAQHSTAQHSTAQHSTAQHSTAQHSPAQPSPAQDAAVQRIAFAE